MSQVKTLYQTGLKLKPEVELVEKRKQVGLLGGNFNPVHTGHLVVAQTVLDILGLDEIQFLPSYLPPHVDPKKTIDEKHRLEMLKRAISDNPHFSIETIELDRKGKSYTIDTMKELIRLHPEIDYSFIIGGDMVEYLPKWKDIDKLVPLVRFIGVRRPNYDLNSPYPIVYVDVPQLDISSSMIRQKIKYGQSPRYLLPESVLKYMEEMELYQHD